MIQEKNTTSKNVSPLMPAGVSKKSTVECDACGLYGMCKVAGLETNNTEILDGISSLNQKTPQDHLLIRAGTPFNAIYAVKTGSFKTFVVNPQGGEQIIDFHFAGELIGLEGLVDGTYPYSVKAMEAGAICRMDVSDLSPLGERIIPFQHQLIVALSKKTLQDLWIPQMMGSQSAEQRLAVFLISLSARFSSHDLPNIDFRLSMSRTEIANYLGLAVETVSRMFQRFHGQGLIGVRGRQVHLADMEGLRQLAGLAPRDLASGSHG